MVSTCQIDGHVSWHLMKIPRPLTRTLLLSGSKHAAVLVSDAAADIPYNWRASYIACLVIHQLIRLDSTPHDIIFNSSTVVLFFFAYIKPFTR